LTLSFLSTTCSSGGQQERMTPGIGWIGGVALGRRGERMRISEFRLYAGSGWVIVVTVFVTKKSHWNASEMELAMFVLVGRWAGIRKYLGSGCVGSDQSTSIFWGGGVFLMRKNECLQLEKKL
jgi:hypothetical protein